MTYANRPPRLTLVNIATTEHLEAQFNPTELEEALGANFARLTVPGLSHQRKQFINTEDDKFTFSIFNHCIGEGPEGQARMLKTRSWLRALVHPRRTGGDRDGSPRTLLIWPGFLSIVCRLTSLGFKYTQFNRMTGAPIAYTASLTMEEQRDSFVGMEDVLVENDPRDVGDLDIRDFGEL